MTTEVDKIPHGTPNGYQNHKCRCPVCRAGWKRYRVELSAQHLADARRDPSLIKHGTYTGYVDQRCDCSLCIAYARRAPGVSRRGGPERCWAAAVAPNGEMVTCEVRQSGPGRPHTIHVGRYTGPDGREEAHSWRAARKTVTRVVPGELGAS